MRPAKTVSTLESVESRRLFALIGPDLQGVGMSITPNDPVPQDGEVTINYSIKNDGGLWGDSGAFWVTFWRSSANPLGSSSLTYTRVTDVRIDRLSKGATHHGSVNIAAPSGNENNQAYLFMQIDTSNAQGEWNEDNNWLTGMGRDVAAYSTEADLGPYPSHETPTRGRWIGVNGVLAGEIGGSEGAGPLDLDIYDLTVVSGQRYMVDIDRTGGLDSYVRVYDANWNLVVQNDNGRDENEAPSTDAYAEWTAGMSGTFHVVVSNAFNHASDPRLMSGRAWSSSGAALGEYLVSVHQISSPIVTTSVIDGWAMEGGDTAIVRIHRTGSPDSSLFVGWSLGGSATYGIEYTLAGANAEGAVIPAGQQYVDVAIHAIDDGAWETSETVQFNFQPGAAYLLGSSGMRAEVQIANASNDRPRIVSSYDVFTDNAGQRVVFHFDDDVAQSLGADDFVLKNLDTGVIISSAKLAVSWVDGAAMIRFSGFTNGRLPDGNYRLTLNGSGIANGGGMSMEGSASRDVWSLAGDVNRDRQVDFSDLLILAQHYGAGGRELGGGNVDGSADGKVDFNDLLLLAQNYGGSLRVPLAPLVFGENTIRRSLRD